VLPRSRYAILISPHARPVVQSSEAVAEIFLPQQTAQRRLLVAHRLTRACAVGVVAVRVQCVVAEGIRLVAGLQALRLLKPGRSITPARYEAYTSAVQLPYLYSPLLGNKVHRFRSLTVPEV